MPTYTSSDGNVRFVIEQTSVNQQYAVLRLYIQVAGNAATSYTAPTINMSSVDSSYVWTGSAGSIPGSGWNTILTKSGVNVWFSSGSSRTVSATASGSYVYDATDEGGEVYTTPYSITGSITITKPAVVNPTTISTSASSVTLGSAINIVAANGTTGNCVVKIGGTTVQTISNLANGTTSWTPALATYAPYITNSSSATATLTWSGVSTSVTIVVPNNSSTKPTCTVAVAVAGSTVGSLYVQNKSQATITVTPTLKYSATVASYNITFGGATYNTSPVTTPILTTSGTVSYSVTITDSRGFTSAAVTGSITVTAYSNPTISGVNIYRSNSAGTIANDGTYLTFKFTPNITALSNNNAKTYGLQYRAQGASSWTSAGTGTLSGYTTAVNQTKSVSLSTTTFYDARVYISDSFETVYSAIVSISTEAVMMDFNAAGTGGAVGMYTQGADRLDVAWQLIPRKGIRSPFAIDSFSRLFVIPYYSAANLGLTSSDTDDTFIQKWTAKVCEIYPSISYGTFVGAAGPGSARFIVATIYNTNDVDSTTRLPRYAFGYVSSENYDFRIFRIYNYTYSGKVISNSSTPAAPTLTSVDSATAVSIPSATYKSCGSITLAAGTWLIKASVGFSANANGTRYVIPSYTANTDSSAVYWSASSVKAPVQRSGFATDVQLSFMVQITETKTIYFNAWQDSGSALNCTLLYQTMKLA